MDEQTELKKDLTSIQGAIKTQDGIYIPLSEVERLLMNRITQVKNCSIPDVSGIFIVNNSGIPMSYHKSKKGAEKAVEEWRNSGIEAAKKVSYDKIELAE